MPDLPFHTSQAFGTTSHRDTCQDLGFDFPVDVLCRALSPTYTLTWECLFLPICHILIFPYISFSMGNLPLILFFALMSWATLLPPYDLTWGLWIQIILLPIPVLYTFQHAAMAMHSSIPVPYTFPYVYFNISVWPYHFPISSYSLQFSLHIKWGSFSYPYLFPTLFPTYT